MTRKDLGIMNLQKSGTSIVTKIALAVFFILLCGVVRADDLNMYVSTTRFMDNAGNTDFRDRL